MTDKPQDTMPDVIYATPYPHSEWRECKDSAEYIAALDDVKITRYIRADIAEQSKTVPDGWQPIETCPQEDHLEYLVLLPLISGEKSVLHVCNWEGEKYPKFMDSNIDYNDRVIGATNWQPLPAAPERI